MDTLFRLVSYLDHQQQQHQTVTRSSSSSRRNTSEEEEECCNVISQNIIYMDEDDFSAGTSSTTGGGGGRGGGGGGGGSGSGGFGCPERFGEVDLSGGRWATDVLVECATALAGRDTGRVQELMWVLNEVASPYGDTEQKLACYFMQGLFSRMTLSGNRCRDTLSSAFDKATSFDSTRRTGLRFMEASPWMSFGHVAANGAILEAFESEQRLHIIDISNTFCTQWPTLLEALATRSSDETPYLRLTTVVASPVVMLDVDQPTGSSSSSVQRVMKEIGVRMEKFARLMGVPFKFQYVHHAGDISGFDFERCIDINSDEALAINCVNSMHGVPTSGGRNAVAEAFRRMKPKLLTIVEEEADIIDNGNDGEGERFLRSFKESLRFFKAYFESLDESFPKTSNERLALERAAGRAILDLVACEPGESGERRETGSSWSNRMRTVGFEAVGLSDDATDDVRALLRRYREGWSLVPSADVDTSAAGIFLAWKDQPVVWSCAWKPG